MSVPRKSITPAELESPCPAYDGLNASERDIEAQAQPPPYAEAQKQTAAASNPLEGQSFPMRLLIGVIAVVLFALGIGLTLTLALVALKLVMFFFQLLAMLWHKVGLI
ncbi:hypothetical protein F4804DRAFT_182128 [Jackrogersella minutella]|nr:hypothetical protein F4804DRAFT_182128 [Jackrogersella minutella]